MIEKVPGIPPEAIDSLEQINGEDLESNKDAGKETESSKITLIYDRENYETSQEKSVEIEFDGDSLKDLHQNALNHLIRLEMGAQPTIVKNTRIKIGNQEMSWDEFEGKVMQG